jgi:hypothetical protein
MNFTSFIPWSFLVRLLEETGVIILKLSKIKKELKMGVGLADGLS